MGTQEQPLMQTKRKEEQICPTEMELPSLTLGEITFQVDLGGGS